MGFRDADDARAIRVAPDPPGIPGAALTRPEMTTETGAISVIFPVKRGIVAHG